MIVSELLVKNLDHLGIVAGIIDEIGIVEYIDKLLGVHPKETVSAGVVVKAMILNGLGFVSAPLYLFEKFFTGIATEHLLGEGVKPEHLNDDRLGAVMDNLFAAGVSETFLGIALQGAQRFSIELKTSHIDSTSFHVHGDYESEEQPETSEPKVIEVTYGYSRDHRPDLKQFVMNLVTTGDGDIPLWIEMASGNQSDKATFVEILQEFRRQWSFDGLCVADSALYSEENLKAMTGMKWVTRVPLTLKEAQELASSDVEFKDSQRTGYRIAESFNQYAGINQRWLMIESAERKKADSKKIDKQLETAKKNAEKQLQAFSKEEFACESDALAAVQKLSKKLSLHNLSEVQVLEKLHYQNSGRPSAKNQPIRTGYYVTACIVTNEVELSIRRQRAGRFILATNVLDVNELSADDALSEYKGQQSPERGFRFLKDPMFFASSVFLKSPKRIEVLGLIMALSLLVYNLAQRHLRKSLEQQRKTISNQLGKPTATPTLRWVFQCFMAIHLVTINGVTQVVNLTDELKHILGFFTKACRSYYLVPEPDP